MGAKIKKVTINQGAAVQALVAQLTPRLEAVGERIAANARKRVKVGTGERQGKPEAITPRLSDKGLSSAQGKQLSDILGGEPPEVVFQRALVNRPKGQSAQQARNEFGKLFRFKAGGGTPDRVDIRKTILRGFRRTKPHLRDTIKSEGVVLRGNTLHLTVAARSDHANLVEKGFHHKGGGQVAARPFLLPALMDEREGLRTGRSLKG